MTSLPSGTRVSAPKPTVRVGGGAGGGVRMSQPHAGLSLIKVCLEVIKAHRDLRTGRRQLQVQLNEKANREPVSVSAVITGATDGHLPTAAEHKGNNASS